MKEKEITIGEIRTHFICMPCDSRRDKEIKSLFGIAVGRPERALILRKKYFEKLRCLVNKKKYF